MKLPVILKHERDKVGDYQKRVLLHFWLGFLMGLTFPLSLGLIWLFVAYEENEDRHEMDKAWKDYAGAIAGYVPGLLVLVTIIILALRG